jgi:hypothetical protein
MALSQPGDAPPPVDIAIIADISAAHARMRTLAVQVRGVARGRHGRPSALPSTWHRRLGSRAVARLLGAGAAAARGSTGMQTRATSVRNTVDPEHLTRAGAARSATTMSSSPPRRSRRRRRSPRREARAWPVAALGRASTSTRISVAVGNAAAGNGVRRCVRGHLPLGISGRALLALVARRAADRACCWERFDRLLAARRASSRISGRAAGAQLPRLGLVGCGRRSSGIPSVSSFPMRRRCSAFRPICSSWSWRATASASGAMAAR